MDSESSEKSSTPLDAEELPLQTASAPAEPSEPASPAAFPSAPNAPVGPAAGVVMAPSPWVRAKREPVSVSRVGMLKYATYLLVAASFGVVFVSAVPAIARELGYVEARVVSRSSARSSSAKRAGLEATKAAERRIEMREEAFGLPHPPTGKDPSQRTKIAVARKDLALHAEADTSSAPVGRVPRNQILIVMKEEAGWLLVLNQDDDNAELGWVRETDVLQR